MIVLLTALQAQAWNHTGFVWELHDTPLQVLVDPTMRDADEWLAAFQHAADAWAATPTALQLSVEMADSGPLAPSSSPGDILVFDDPHDNIGAEYPAATWSYPTGDVAYSYSYWDTYSFLYEADIRINDTGTFVGIDQPCEGDENIREIVAVHELGHALGLDHSCDEGVDCAELLESAVMYWDDSGCTANRTPNADDLDGIGLLYDAAGRLSVTTGESSGELPREVCFATDPNSIDAEHVEWDFGDGGTGEGDEACHSFETAGEFDVAVTYFSEPEDEAPRSWIQTIIQCPSLPGPAEGAEHLFQLDTVGTQIQLLPTVDLRWECVQSVRWSVLHGDETLFEQPASMSLVDVGEYGKYTVVLRVTGVGGEVEEEQTVTLSAAPQDDGGGCSTVRARGGLALLGFVLSALYGRRARPESGHGGRTSSHFGAR